MGDDEERDEEKFHPIITTSTEVSDAYNIDYDWWSVFHGVYGIGFLLMLLVVFV